MTPSKAPPVGGGEETLAQLRSSMRDVRLGTQPGGSLHEKLGEWFEQIEALQADLSAPAPSGDYVLVPREPTETMWDAWNAEFNRWRGMGRGDNECWWMAYGAMLSAAPVEGGGGEDFGAFRDHAHAASVKLEGVDLAEIDRLFAEIPDGPYDALHRQDGWEVRQVDTDPGDKHHWPFRLCESIAGQTAACDEAAFGFIAAILNTWPTIREALSSQTQVAGEGSRDAIKPSDVEAGKVGEALQRLQEFAAGNGPDLHPFHDHNGFEQHDQLRDGVRTLLSALTRRPGVEEVVAALWAHIGLAERAAPQEDDADEVTPVIVDHEEAAQAILSPFPPRSDDAPGRTG